MTTLQKAETVKGLVSSPAAGRQWKPVIGFGAAILVLILIMMAPFPATLTPMGRSLLAVLAFMVVIWVSEAMSYPASSVMLIISMVGLLGIAPAKPGGAPMGTAKALTLALSGFSSSAWILVVAALFIAAAMSTTGLGQRIGLWVLSVVGTKPRQVILGLMLMSYVLTIVIPAQAANAAAMTAICMSVINSVGLERKKNFAKSMLITVALATGVAGLGILTSGAPPIQTAKYISDATKHTIGWLEWAYYGMPFSIAVGAVLYLLITRLFPAEVDDLPGGRKMVEAKLRELGPMPAREKRLLGIMAVTIILWATGMWHPIDTSTVAVLALLALLFPGIGVGTWKELVVKVDWGTLMLFGGAISLGQLLLSSGAAKWVSNATVIQLGVGKLSMVLLITVGGAFFALFSLAFSARSAAVAALVPTAIGFAQGLARPDVNVWGLSLILYFAIQFSVVFPANTPMAMVAYGTDTFETRDLMKVAIPMTIVAVLLMALFSATYWRWVGII